MDIDTAKKVDFTYPEGFQEALDSLTFLPEEQRAMMVAIILNIVSLL